MRNIVLCSLLPIVAGLSSFAAQAAPDNAPAAVNPYMQMVPASSAPFLTLPSLPDLSALTNNLPLAGMPLPFIGTLNSTPTKPYTMRPGIPQQTKRQMMQMMMPIMSNVMRMSMPDAMNWFAYKVKVKKGVSYDDVVESMKLRANKLNFKYVGVNAMWKDFQAVLGDKDAPRIEVHSFCDIAVARELLKISPEFLVFLPCRIAIMEDANKDIWVMMLDWNMDWVSGYEGQMGINGDLGHGAKDIRDKMEEIMLAGAAGDL